ncbi:carotenoid oxygenase family protein [Streptomyces sp. MK37H]|uniref:carotenoid oxygenase family protein n=1 Tax=Streptomyces sp. MK37H TaxID=2699117 RepID=UPI001B3950FD|nr:hypothetical protein [Streptomyces sp. MK37H]
MTAGSSTPPRAAPTLPRAAPGTLIVLDARDITAAPVATVDLPHRVPAGIHGSWIPDLPDAATGP